MQGNTAFLKPLQQGLQELPVVELAFIRQVEALGKPLAQAWLECVQLPSIHGLSRGQAGQVVVGAL
jgi:hypothetical protein